MPPPFDDNNGGFGGPWTQGNDPTIPTEFWNNIGPTQTAPNDFGTHSTGGVVFTGHDDDDLPKNPADFGNQEREILPSERGGGGGGGAINGGQLRQSLLPINKGGGQNFDYSTNCSFEDLRDLHDALTTAQSKIRDKIQELRDRLAPCDKDGRMTKLLDCIEAEGDSTNFWGIMSQINCFPIYDKNGKYNPDIEAQTTYFDPAPNKHDDYSPGNTISFNLNKIKQSAHDNKLRLNPPLTYQDILARCMLHELMHNCTENRGPNGKDDYPEVTELDVQVLTNMLGYPRDPKGIDKGALNRIKEDNTMIIDLRGSMDPKLSSAHSPLLNGNFFIWDPNSGQIFCTDQYDTTFGVKGATHEIFGNEYLPGELPPLLTH